MAASSKDTVYIDIDDEITGVIDKVKNSPGGVVALVLPKRAAVFQSIVNMKLLKRAADEAKKNVVLITAESGLMPLAGAAGVYVAKTLTSKPEIPLGPQGLNDDEELADEDAAVTAPEEITAETAGDTPVGDLAAGAAGTAGAAAAPKPPAGDLETIELDDDELPEDQAPTPTKDFTPPKPKKDKKLRVPNFNRFRLLLTLGGVLLVALIVFIILAVSVLPKATIDIKTDAVSIPVSLTLNLSTSANSLNTNNDTVPAQTAQQQKTFSQQVTTTGSKNNGTKASGTVTMTDCVQGYGNAQPVPAGTGLSVNGQTYITQETTTFGHSGTPDPQNGCFQYSANGTTDIVAQSPGSSFNVSGANFTVAGRSDVNASGSASGGTDDIQQVVSASDITNAKNKISTSDNGVQQALSNQLKGEGYYPIKTTFNAGTPSVTQSANVGDAASTVTVTETITYTMFGAQQADLKNLLDSNIRSQMNGSSQSLLDDGLSQATFSVNNTTSNSAQVDMSANATAGPQLNIANIKQQAAGKKPGDVENQLKNNSDVTSVSVHLSPFWVSSVPSKISKITVNVAKPTKAASQSSGGNP